MRKWFDLALALALTLGSIGHVSGQSPAPSAGPVDLEVPLAPTPVRADGKFHLAYELHVTNFRAPELSLMRVEVFGEGPQAPPLARYEGRDLQSRLIPVGT
jgi:murein DD-endopeptidase